MRKKKNKKFLGFINLDAFTLFHYLPLIAVIYLAQLTAQFLDVNDLISISPVGGWIALIGINYIFLLVGDQLIHFIGGRD